jgi:predicted RNA binding protein YcfA (HicA-like mRNA interferase family)
MVKCSSLKSRYPLGKLRVLSGAEVCRILEQNGFVVDRQRGSHRVMQLRLSGSTVSVPVPLHSPVRTGTLISIIRQSGLPRTLFESES